MTRNAPRFDFIGKTTFVIGNGGRKWLPTQGYRPDLKYHSEPLKIPPDIYMIWPTFVDKSGIPILDDIPVPNPGIAKFTIVNNELRKSYHRNMIKIGTLMDICEGSHVVGLVEVTQILDLFNDA